MPPYDEWARFYDFTEGDRSKLIDFYGSLISKRTRSLLELGCGTGAVTLALAQRILECGAEGVRITGLDESPEMLRRARARSSEIEWVLGDLRSPPVHGSYDLIVCCFYALHNLLSEHDLSAAFAAVERLLSANGIFAFDVYQPNIAYLSQPRQDKLIYSIADADGRKFEVRDDWDFDAASRILTIDRRLVPADDRQATLGNLRIRLRQYFPDEIDRLLAMAGLSVVQRFGDLDRSAFDGRAKNQVVICRRAG